MKAGRNVKAGMLKEGRKVVRKEGRKVEGKKGEGRKAKERKTKERKAKERKGEGSDRKEGSEGGKER